MRLWLMSSTSRSRKFLNWFRFKLVTLLPCKSSVFNLRSDCTNSTGISDTFPFVMCKRSSRWLAGLFANELTSSVEMLWFSNFNDVNLPRIYENVCSNFKTMFNGVRETQADNCSHGNNVACAVYLHVHLLTLTAFGNVVNCELCISSSFNVSFTPRNTCSSMSSSGVSLMMILCASMLRNIVPNRTATRKYNNDKWVRAPEQSFPVVMGGRWDKHFTYKNAISQRGALRWEASRRPNSQAISISWPNSYSRRIL